MNKSCTLLAAAAVALSLLAPTTLAGTTKTASDYADLTGVNSELTTKIDALLAKGVFEGVSDDSFGISQPITRAQFAKVACLVFGLPVDSTIPTTSFSDVRFDDPANSWAIPYIEAAKRAGLIDGITDTTFAPGDHVSIGQLDTVLVKGLGKKVNGAASPWYADAVIQATQLSIHPANKSGDEIASRADLVLSAYAALQAAQPTQPAEQQEQVSISSVQATGDHTVQVLLDNAVDTSKATLSLTKDGAAVAATTTWSADGKSAVLTLPVGAKLSSGSYAVTLGGLAGSQIKGATGTVTIGTSAESGNITYAVTELYEVSNVIDSGLTASATGTQGYVTQAQAEDPTLSKFAKEIELTATTSSGEEVAIPGIIQSISSSNTAVVKAAVSSDRKGFVLGNKAGTAAVSIVYTAVNGATKQMTIPVTVKDVNVAADMIEAGESSIEHSLTVTGGVYSSHFNAYEKMDLKITDNYGIEYEVNEIQQYNFALGTMFYAEDITGDPDAGSAGTVTVEADGAVHIRGNVNKFTLTALIPNGDKAYASVDVTRD
ncbi:S-layer homology domain-containing protein [Paenibacillus xerothermodurans]|uniref:S-layer homology domain-containing protein n=1 Tax=Paenibacillus xerothermodurans TaxID=1977292 RepID=A0A2W1NBC4_PAEXE|nr:S-layer homology domain-containing protein [Paenibacillus xerothermodurans]PZE21999.1 S-layer homology domain-containing protein [Paenibacillus xerothermodurans]